MRLRPAFALIAALLVIGCRAAEPDSIVWFVHATDPHLFDEAPKCVPAADAQNAVPVQKKLNEQAFEQLLAAIPNLPEGGPPAFLLLTGDLGLERLAGAVPPAAGPAPGASAAGTAPTPSPPPAGPSTGARAAAPRSAPSGPAAPSGPTAPAGGTPPPADKRADDAAAECQSTPDLPPIQPAAAAADLARMLRSSRVKDVYLVLGNNDVAGEAAAGDAVRRSVAFLAGLQNQLAGSGVTVHDLTACYLDESMPCYADVPGTGYRLVGFPSYSFKNRDAKSRDANGADQVKQIERFAALVERAGQDGKRVLVASHIPDIDDPYTLARIRFQGLRVTSAADPERPAATWNLSPEAMKTWRKAVASDTVAAVFAGHLHDSHKEIYRRPYPWSAVHDGSGKLYLAPPLAVRLQDTSPIQARGLSLVGLAEDHVSQRLYWYDGQGAFRPDRPAAPGRRPRGAGPGFAARILGSLYALGADKVSASRLAVIAIAFLVAFLTVVELWKVPPTTTRLTKTDDGSAGAAAPPAPQGSASSPAGTQQATLFQSNFAKTVVTGLGGLIVVNGVYAIWNENLGDVKTVYLVWFVIFFFILLLALALFQGLVEGLRSRVAADRRPPRPDAAPPPGGARRLSGLRRGFSSLLSRAWRWLLSLRATVLIFVDTVFGVLLGRNQLTSAALSKEIVNLQLSMVRTADRVREAIQQAVVDALAPATGAAVPPADVRVNVSVLSADGASVYYISESRGSLDAPFPKHSVAWVAVFNGEARWWKKGYDDFVLFVDRSGTQPKDVLMKDYFQPRSGMDYQAFIMLPVPWRGRGSSNTQKAAVHISFRVSDHIDKLWAGLDDDAKNGYASWGHLLEEATEGVHIKSSELQAVLHEGLVVLGEVLSNFNEAVFDAYIRPSLTD